MGIKTSKQLLFGFQSIGGSELPISNSYSAMGNARDPFTYKAQQCVRHLFVDSNGTFNTGSDVCPTIASGIFVQELDREAESPFAMNEYFKHVRDLSDENGFAVLQGIKQFGRPMRADLLEELVIQKRAEQRLEAELVA